MASGKSRLLFLGPFWAAAATDILHNAMAIKNFFTFMIQTMICYTNISSLVPIHTPTRNIPVVSYVSGATAASVILGVRIVRVVRAENRSCNETYGSKIVPRHRPHAIFSTVNNHRLTDMGADAPATSGIFSAQAPALCPRETMPSIRSQYKNSEGDITLRVPVSVRQKSRCGYTTGNQYLS